MGIAHEQLFWSKSVWPARSGAIDQRQASEVIEGAELALDPERARLRLYVL
jgi:hypothetical protein